MLSVCFRVVGCRLRRGGATCLFLKDWDGDIYLGRAYLGFLLLRHVEHSRESFRLHVLWRDWNVTREDIAREVEFRVKGNKSLRLDVDNSVFCSLLRSFDLL